MSIVTKQSKYNLLFSRRQLHLQIFPSPGTTLDPLSLISTHFTTSPQLIIILETNNNFGGISKTCRVHLYDDLPSLLKYEPLYQLAKLNIVPQKPYKRKIIRLQKARQTWHKGTEKANIKKNSGRVTYDYEKYKKEFLENQMM